MASSGDWCLIESDPSVFTELIHGYGVKGVQVEELWSLDDEILDQLKPVHGIVFLFKWRPEEQPAGTIVQDSRLEKIFFAKQVINNACATQAILSVLLNCQHEHVELGEMLSAFKENTLTFDPAMKGLSLSNMDQIRAVHNSFSRQQLFEFDQSVKEDEEPFHFSAYVPISGRLYELDGLKEGPADLGKIVDSNWMKTLRPVLEARMKSFNSDEIRFNVMALISDRRKLIYKDMTTFESQRNELLKKMEEVEKHVPQSELEDDTTAPAEYRGLRAQLKAINDEMTVLNMRLREEEQKMERHKVECLRHKHNYMPLIVQLLKILGERGELVDMVEEAKKKAASRKRKEPDS